MSIEGNYTRMKALFNSIEGLNLRDAKNGDFKFIVYQNEKYKDVDIEQLDLGVRSLNCLRRAGYHTVYDLITNISGRTDLLRIRNCGVTSSREIMESLFLFQYAALRPEQRNAYINKIVKMNS